MIGGFLAREVPMQVALDTSVRGLDTGYIMGCRCLFLGDYLVMNVNGWVFWIWVDGVLWVFIGDKCA